MRACWLEGKITNAETGAGIFGAEVSINSTQANYTSADLVGNYKTGQAIPGTFDVTFSAAGYISKTLPAVLENGVLTILDVQLEPIVPVSEFSGFLLNAVDGSPIPAAHVILESPTFSFATITDANGKFVFTDIFRDEFTLAAGKWGFKHAAMRNLFIDDSTDPVTLEAHLGYQDDFFSSLGWTTETTAASGWWTRDIPIRTLFNGESANPSADVPDDLGSQCFMTANNGGSASQDDVDDGYVRLISPAMDLTIYYEPVLSYNTWFVNVGGPNAPNDSFQIRITNGAEEVVLETVKTSNPAWNARSEFKLSDYIAITDNMRVIFEASDETGTGNIVEAAVDAFLIEDSAFPPFENTATEGCSVFEVSFKELSGYAYQWDWTFENGDPSVSSNPEELVSFTMPGQHSVSLEVTTTTGVYFILNHPDYVNVLDVPAPGFNYTDVGGQVTFENISVDADSYLWSFNDGSDETSDELDPTHTFPAAGSYDVVLAATNTCGTVDYTGTVIIDAVPPIVQFSTENSIGCSPLTVQFTDLSEHVPTSWQWSFPGGTPATSTEQNPVVVYQNAGTYCAELNISNAAGSDGTTICDIVEVGDVPNANYDFNVSGPEVVFNNTSLDADSYQWQFNDGLGSTSDEESPTHAFPDLGDYEVILSATNECGTVYDTQTVTITAIQPTAYFTATNSVGCVPLTVQFNDQSMGGEISNWEWSFPGGDPSSSTEQNPIVTYTIPSFYNASLVVTNPVGQDEIMMFDAVTIIDTPYAAYTYDVNGPVVNFNSTILDADNWVWKFGDANNSTSTEANPTFEFDTLGTFTVILEASNDCGTRIVEHTVEITEIAPSAKFSFTNAEGCAPIEVSFSDESTGGGINSWEWTFPGGDPASSTEQNPTVLYTQAGTYSTTLKISNSVGEQEITEMDIIVVDDVPAPDFDFIINGPMVEFTNNSSNADILLWHFGNSANTSSAEANPTFIYDNINTFTVTLETTNDCGTTSISKEINIQYIFPNAAFSYTNTKGCTPLEITFKDESTGGGIDTWQWDFPGGDPSTSTESEQMVVYENPGTYSVSLNITNPVGESEIIETDLVIVQPSPVADFDFSINGSEVQFSNLSIFADAYEWNMGDSTGTGIIEINPFYTFPEIGEYEITLSATNDCGMDVFSQIITITSLTPATEKELLTNYFYAAPNPFLGRTKIVYELEQPINSGKFILTNVFGETIAIFPFNSQKGAIYLGENITANGLYFLQIMADGKRGDVLKLIKY